MADIANLLNSDLQPIIVEAKQVWADALGPDNARLAVLNSVTIEVADLPDNMIGATVGDMIIVDRNAAGWGWFVDQTPADNNEFSGQLAPGVFVAKDTGPANGRMDLLSTVLHEMGNAMGFNEDTGQDVTGMVLQAGVRRLPVADPQSTGTGVTPVIDWNKDATNVTIGVTQPTSTVPSWLGNFVNNLGQTDSQANPNGGIRIKLPGTGAS
jgi:hypothetical protein